MKPRMNPRRLWLLLILALALALTWSTAGAAPAAIDLPVVQLPPVWTADGDQKGAEFGCAAAGVGDVNGDGYADLLFGSYRYEYDIYREGAVFLFLGGSGGLQPSADWTAAGSQKGAEFGQAVAAAGDVNADGFADFLVGAPRANNTPLALTLTGGAFLYLGGPHGPQAAADWAALGDQQDAEFGSALGGAGDVNGDGYDDVLVAAPKYANDESGNNQGRVSLYLGGPSGLAVEPAWTMMNYQNSAQMGAAVGGAGDLNADGYADVFIGAPSFDQTLADEGAVFVFYGSPSGLAAEPDQALYGGAADSWFGHSVAAAGDVDGDGYADLLAGAPYYPNGLSGNGRVFLFRGGPQGLASTPAWTAAIRQSFALFGWRVVGGGDINADGYADVAVGAHHYDDDQPDEGGLFVYYGSPFGLGSAPEWLASGDKADTDFALGLALAGDVNGDGFADVAAGAPRFFLETEPMGRLFLFYGLADETLPELQLLTHLPLMLRQSAP